MEQQQISQRGEKALKAALKRLKNRSPNKPEKPHLTVSPEMDWEQNWDNSEGEWGESIP